MIDITSKETKFLIIERLQEIVDKLKEEDSFITQFKFDESRSIPTVKSMYPDNILEFDVSSATWKHDYSINITIKGEK